jgi:hypothetical protein
VVCPQTETPLEQLMPSNLDTDSDLDSTQDNAGLFELKAPLGGPAIGPDPVPIQKQQTEQAQIEIVLSEIQLLLREPHSGGLAIESQRTTPVIADQHHNEPKMNDLVAKEIEALLGISQNISAS